MKKALIVEGGGFRTGYSTGVLDAFLTLGYDPFDQYFGNSGGAISSSYFLSKQHGACFEAMKYLAADPEFVKFKHIIAERGYMNIDRLRAVADSEIPFHLESAVKNTADKLVNFVATNRDTGTAVYLTPTIDDWIESVIASCTLPFVTKGSHVVNGMDLMDGGWSDPLPIKWAVEQGATDIVVVRTSHIDRKVTQSWPDYFGSIYFRSHKALSDCFARSHEVRNAAVEYLNNPPKGIKIQQIWPEDGLKCGSTSYSVEGIKNDYRYGLHSGLNFVDKQMKG